MTALVPEQARPSTRGYRWRSDRTRTAVTQGSDADRVSAMARSIGQAAVEILAGTRPASQLSRWSTPDVVERFTQRAALLKLVQEQCPGRAELHLLHRSPRVRRIRVCEPAPQCYEAAVVIDEAGRSRAVALRIERTGRQWRVVHLEVA